MGAKLQWQIVPGLLLLSCIASFPYPGFSQDLQICTEVNAISGYKVLLDEIKFNSGQLAASDQHLMDLLNFQLRNRLEVTDADQSIRYRVIRCPGRKPEGQESFPQLIADGLVSRDVVLEVWGEVFPGNQGHRTVFLNYAMFPIQSTNISAFFLRQYEPRVGSSPDELVVWLSSLSELRAYALVGRAIRMLINNGPRAFDQANTDLVTAGSTLKAAFGSGPTAPQKQLLQYIDDRKCQLLKGARASSGYNGPLKLIPESVLNRQCPP